MYQPPTITFTLSFPGVLLEPSLLDLTVTSSTSPGFPYLGQVYDAWCLDRMVQIDVTAAYTAKVYSSYELFSFAGEANLAFHGNSANLDNVNWLLNYYTGPATGYTYGEVQGAIWKLLGSNPIAGYVGPQDALKVDALYNLALANDNFVPDAGQAIGMIVDPVSASGVHAQPLVIETQAAKLGDFVWNDLNADGIQNAGELGIAGATVKLVRDMDGDGLFISPNEVLATTTTDAAGAYSFKGLMPGLSYQVLFTMPGNYDALSPRQADGSATSGVNSDGLLSNVVVLAPGEFNRSIDSGFYKFASLGDRVWVDVNGNNVQDVGDVGLVNVTVQLKNSLGTVVATTTTDANGLYHFNGLIPSTYSVCFVKPAGYDFAVADQGGDDAADSDANVVSGITAQVTLVSGETNNTVDAGLVSIPARLSGYVYEDFGNDGMRGAGEPVIAGVTLVLTGIDNLGNAVNRSTVTDVNGFYEFTGLRAGTYAVTETQPGAYLDGKDTAGSSGGSVAVNDVISNVVLAAGANSVNNNFGELVGAQIHGNVYCDDNNDGIKQAGELGLGGVPVRLQGTNDLNQAVDITINTNPDGSYAFNGLRPGTYSVTETAQPAGKLDGKETAGTAGGNTGVNEIISGIVLTQGFISSDNNFGEILPAQVSGFVYCDINNDGIKQAGDLGIGGVPVRLQGINDRGVAVDLTLNTNADGSYAFTGLRPGTYSVTETAQPAGKADGKETAGSTGGNTSVNEVISSIVVGAGQSSTNNNFGEIQPAKAHIGDLVFEDKNANGVQDAGEVGIANVTVNLCDAAGLIVGTTTTDAAGKYGFDVVAGTYAVKVVAPATYLVTGKDVGGNTVASDAVDSDIDATTGKTGNYVLNPGDVNNTVDAGLYRTASLGDRVWLDCNSNGVQDAGELGVANFSVKLLNAAGAVVATQTTDANGNYLFSGLVPGSYAVQFGTLSGYNFTGKDLGGNDANDSDADPVTGRTIYTTLDSGEVDRSWDAGLQPLCRNVTFDFSGNSATDGPDGNSRSYTDALTGVSVTARAFSQDKNQVTNAASDVWQSAFLGSYGGGLGVTDSSEGNGSGNAHTIDNVGRNNYIVLQFSQAVELDKAFLGYVVGDSDLQVWIGNSATPITTMSNAVLASMGFSEVNTTTETTARWADLNAGNVAGNVIIIAADTTDTTPEDYFKLQQLALCAPDLCAPVAKASIGNFVWDDKNFNGVQDSGEAGIANVTVNLLNSAGTVLSTTTTDAGGLYSFSNLNPADYKIQVVAPTGYFVSKKDQGGNDALDSDIDSTGTTVVTTLSAGENDLSWDAGLYRKASVGDKVWSDSNHNNLQDVGEVGIAHIVVKLLDTSGTVLASTSTNSSGNYLFSDLDPGSYVLQFDKTGVKHYEWGQWNDLKKWAFAVKDVGSNDAVDSDVAGDAYATNNVSKTDAFMLMSGQNDLTRDAGITPIVLDLDGNGIHTISRADSKGAFDLFGNGTAIQSGWISGSDGFLAVDKNGNGKIDSIGELFGGNAKGAGFASLAAFDSNGDGLVNNLDADFGKLMIWRDANGNHATDAGELVGLAQAGVASLTVGYTELPFVDAQGNLHLERSSATLDSGASVAMTDVYFNVSADDAAAAGIQLPSMADLLGDDRALDVVVGGSDRANTCQQRLADDTGSCHAGDAGEMLRRLAALSQTESHAVAG